MLSKKLVIKNNNTLIVGNMWEGLCKITPIDPSKMPYENIK